MTSTLPARSTAATDTVTLPGARPSTVRDWALLVLPLPSASNMRDHVVVVPPCLELTVLTLYDRTVLSALTLSVTYVVLMTCKPQ